mmetsp:Transcript_36773/g.99493  ORF Transcript_36773/g.99493 Transcript_36773/m.99493 type:complete len:209 (-) Transcript_36773:127-753(-)
MYLEISRTAMGTRSARPITTTSASSSCTATPSSSEIFWSTSTSREAGSWAGRTFWAHRFSSSSSSFSATTMPSCGPKIRTSCRERSMWILQPLSSWSCITMASLLLSSVRVRKSSAQTAAGTSFRGPPRLASCRCAASMAALGPQMRSVPRTRSSFMTTWQLLWMSRSRRRLRPHKVLRSSVPSCTSIMVTPLWPRCCITSLPSSKAL